VDPDIWYSTEDVARLIGGVSSRWVRIQIEEGRLRARVLLTGRRATYRIRDADLTAFVKTHVLDDARMREL
jgi:hypothetical protein